MKTSDIGFYILDTSNRDTLTHDTTEDKLLYGDSSMVTIRENKAAKEVSIWHI